jgi:hypothetical protein
MNFGAKRVELVRLMRKFVQQSRVRIFHNERTRSTHLNPNSCFGAFWTVSLLQELRCKTGRTGAIDAQVRATKSCRNFSQWTHPIYLIGLQTHVLVRSRSFCYCTNFSAKRAELVQLMHKFVQRIRVGIFHIERTRSTLLHSNSYFGVFQTVSL